MEAALVAAIGVAGIVAGKWWEARNDYRRWLRVERTRAFSELVTFLTGLIDELPRDSDLQKRAPEVLTGITSRMAAARLVGTYELHKLATKALEDALRHWFARRGVWRDLPASEATRTPTQDEIEDARRQVSESVPTFVVNAQWVIATNARIGPTRSQQARRRISRGWQHAVAAYRWVRRSQMSGEPAPRSTV